MRVNVVIALLWISQSRTLSPSFHSASNNWSEVKDTLASLQHISFSFVRLLFDRIIPFNPTNNNKNIHFCPACCTSNLQTDTLTTTTTIINIIEPRTDAATRALHNRNGKTENSLSDFCFWWKSDHFKSTSKNIHYTSLFGCVRWEIQQQRKLSV